MKISFLGHACFLIEEGGCTLLTDPFLTGNPAAAMDAGSVRADYIALTHGHGDHVGDTEAIAQREGAAIITTIDTAEALFSGRGYKLMVGNIGGEHNLPFGSIKYVSAVHGSGVAGGLACGFLIRAGEKKIYFAGDTALTMDMALLKDEGVDIAILPIGGMFTMGPEDALRAVRLTGAELVIPMHYNTFPGIAQDGEAFAEAVNRTGARGAALRPGESIEI